jgi:succinoglycan biosynthesis transport protein ExoP
MQPDHTSRVLALRPREVAPVEEEPVRAVSVWAQPPNLPVLVMLGETRPDAPAALRVLRHRLEVRRAAGHSSYGVTSARDGEGKSTLAAQLALVLSEAQRARVLLVEANLERPTLARLLGFEVPPGMGLSVQIAKRMEGGSDPWSVLAVGPTLHALVENEDELGYPGALHSPLFRRAVERLGRGYEWVIIDAPSVLGTGDANVVESVVDGMIVVARSGRSRGSDLRAAMKQLGDRKAVGVVMWDVPTAAASAAK